ncbi:hypothetical protein P879_00221 [Paragonimus westermani]|uniref:Ig-like domain-containing protein n=1 Tax=Paragonimus westermani TaxID=34504 RepID=A0A8T0DT47_9TREM|nr:hypothetical protein P879_00221 [Paragonimus westermani]
MEIEEGFLLSLKCRVEGDSNPKIHWFKDGVPINSNHNPNADITVAFQKSQLRIKNMRLSDSGNYSCLGASETSRMSRWVYVTVLPKTDERKVADEKAYNVCPINMCNVGKCLVINNQPVCRCPPSHTGSNCSQLLVHPSSSASRSTTKSATMEKDFILDQTQGSNRTPSSLTGVMDDYFDRCDLQEFKHSPECAQVNSHFYAFIGTAIACSVIILLLGSCLGYIRRRKILNRQNQLQPTRSNGDTHLDNTSGEAVFSKNVEFHQKLPRNENSELDTSLFTRLTSGLVTPTMMMTSRTTKVDSTATRLGSAMHLSKTNSVSPILNAVHPHPPPSSPPAAYVVLTSTQSINQPLQLHPIAEFVMPSSLIGTSSTNPIHESSPSRLRTQLNLSTQAHAEIENTHRMEYDHMLDTTSQVFQRFHQTNAYPNPAEVGAVFECSQTPVSPTTTPSCTQQIFVQIPNLPAPIFFDNQTDQSTALIGNVLTESQSSFPTTQLAIDLYGNSNHSSSPGTHTGTALLIDSNQLCTTQGGKFLMDSPANPDCVPQTKIKGGQDKARNAESYFITFQSHGQVVLPAKSNTFHLPDLT